MVDQNMQSGRELFVVFAVQRQTEEKAESSRVCRPGVGAGSVGGQPCQALRICMGVLWCYRGHSLCFKSRGNKETRLSLNTMSPVLGL